MKFGFWLVLVIGGVVLGLGLGLGLVTTSTASIALIPVVTMSVRASEVLGSISKNWIVVESVIWSLILTPCSNMASGFGIAHRSITRER